MRIAWNLQEAAGFGPAVLTIGKFDGVHAGHRLLIRRVVEIARARGLRPAVLTFHPHPAQIVAPGRAPKPLSSMEERCALMTGLGIEQIFVLPFTAEVARLTPEEFVATYVCETFRARVVLVGRNFRFGHKQSGDPEVLTELGERYGYETRVVEPVFRRGLLVSSSEARTRVETGEVALAARLLERPYSLGGRVVPGHGVGAKQTVPTLNLASDAEVFPRDGVYITRTRDLDDNRIWNSITNIGVRPTFDGHDRTVETFLLEPLAGPAPANIRVAFLRRVRDERKFETPDALKSQILRDVGRAQVFFRRVAHWAPGAVA